MSATKQAHQYLADYGNCSYSPLDTKKIIVALLEEIKALENRIEKARDALYF